jgi:hypothetical protein
MRKTTMSLTAVAVMLASFAGVALARTIDGNNRDNQLFGTDRSDTIRGFGGEDQIFGGDRPDEIRAVDRSEDDVYCGRDRVRVNPGDNLFDCERVTRDAPGVG